MDATEKKAEEEVKRLKRVKKNCSEAIGDGMDLLWSSNGKYLWFSRKSRFCPQYITESDLKDMKDIKNKLEIREKSLDDCHLNIEKDPKKDKLKETQIRVHKLQKKTLDLIQLCGQLIDRLDQIIRQNKRK